MIQIVVTLGAFCVACIVLFFMHIAGVEYAQQFETSTYLIYMIVSVVLLAAGIAYYVYKRKKKIAAQEEEDAKRHSGQPLHDPDDPYDFRPKSKNSDDE